MSGIYFGGQVAAGLGDDLHDAFDEQTSPPVGLEYIERQARDLIPRDPDCLDDIEETSRKFGRRHQNTCSAAASIRSRKTG